jgi:chloramphenicol 3-O-phosphotransferase
MLGAGTTGEAWFHTGDDHVTARVPRRLITPRSPEEPATMDGWDIPVVDRTLIGRPHAGPVALQILDGMYLSSAAMASAGVRVILDDVVWEQAVADLADRAMRNVSRVVVEVTCEFAVALEREAHRLDRYGGAVAAYASQPPIVTNPDVRLDTTGRTSGECATELVGLVRRLERGHSLA